MIKNSLVLYFLLGSSLVAGSAGRCDLPEPKNWTQLHQLLRPTPEETRWLRIPWRTQLWEARREAAAAGKPLLLWEMDGHPLGCT